MKTAINIKTERLHRRIFEAEQAVTAWSGRPYNGYSQQCELARWRIILKHREAMLKHFNSIARN